MVRVLDPHDCIVEDAENWVLLLTAPGLVSMNDCDTSEIRRFQGIPKPNYC